MNEVKNLFQYNDIFNSVKELSPNLLQLLSFKDCMEVISLINYWKGRLLENVQKGEEILLASEIARLESLLIKKTDYAIDINNVQAQPLIESVLESQKKDIEKILPEEKGKEKEKPTIDINTGKPVQKIQTNIEDACNRIKTLIDNGEEEQACLIVEENLLTEQKELLLEIKVLNTFGILFYKLNLIDHARANQFCNLFFENRNYTQERITKWRTWIVTNKGNVIVDEHFEVLSIPLKESTDLSFESLKKEINEKVKTKASLNNILNYFTSKLTGHKFKNSNGIFYNMYTNLHSINLIEALYDASTYSLNVESKKEKDDEKKPIFLSEIRKEIKELLKTKENTEKINALLSKTVMQANYIPRKEKQTPYKWTQSNVNSWLKGIQEELSEITEKKVNDYGIEPIRNSGFDTLVKFYPEYRSEEGKAISAESAIADFSAAKNTEENEIKAFDKLASIIVPLINKNETELTTLHSFFFENRGYDYKQQDRWLNWCRENHSKPEFDHGLILASTSIEKNSSLKVIWDTTDKKWISIKTDNIDKELNKKTEKSTLLPEPKETTLIDKLSDFVPMGKKLIKDGFNLEKIIEWSKIQLLKRKVEGVDNDKQFQSQESVETFARKVFGMQFKEKTENTDTFKKIQEIEGKAMEWIKEESNSEKVSAIIQKIRQEYIDACVGYTLNDLKNKVIEIGNAVNKPLIDAWLKRIGKKRSIAINTGEILDFNEVEIKNKYPELWVKCSKYESFEEFEKKLIEIKETENWQVALSVLLQLNRIHNFKDIEKWNDEKMTDWFRDTLLNSLEKPLKYEKITTVDEVLIKIQQSKSKNNLRSNIITLLNKAEKQGKGLNDVRQHIKDAMDKSISRKVKQIRRMPSGELDKFLNNLNERREKYHAEDVSYEELK